MPTTMVTSGASMLEIQIETGEHPDLGFKVDPMGINTVLRSIKYHFNNLIHMLIKREVWPKLSLLKIVDNTNF